MVRKRRVKDTIRSVEGGPVGDTQKSKVVKAPFVSRQSLDADGLVKLIQAVGSQLLFYDGTQTVLDLPYCSPKTSLKLWFLSSFSKDERVRVVDCFYKFFGVEDETVSVELQELLEAYGVRNDITFRMQPLVSITVTV